MSLDIKLNKLSTPRAMLAQDVHLHVPNGVIHTYPTLAEANKYAAGQWKRAHQPTALLNWVRRYHDWRRG